MELFKSWIKEDGPRLQGSRDLDSAKLQSPCIVRLPSGGYRLFYTAVGPAKPFPDCQGYILSAVSEDGLTFQTEPGIRLTPQPKIPHMSLRVISTSVTMCADGRWRMYFESRGPASIPTVICSAISSDMLRTMPRVMRGESGVSPVQSMVSLEARRATSRLSYVVAKLAKSFGSGVRRPKVLATFATSPNPRFQE